MSKKIILVTGASSDLGKTVIDKLSQDNHVVSDRFDVTSDRACEKAFTAVLRKYKRIDVVVNIAGVTTSGPTADEDSNSFLNILNVNVVSHLRINNHVIAIMKKQKSKGRIVNITSLSGLVPLPGFGIYSASKAAAESLGLAMHYELERDGIKVTNIAPGATKFKNTLSKKISHKTAREKLPILKFLLPMTTPDNIAERIASLVEDDTNPSRIILGADAKIIYMLYRFLPLAVFEKIVLLIWQRK